MAAQWKLAMLPASRNFKQAITFWPNVLLLVRVILYVMMVNRMDWRGFIWSSLSNFVCVCMFYFSLGAFAHIVGLPSWWKKRQLDNLFISVVETVQEWVKSVNCCVRFLHTQTKIHISKTVMKPSYFW